jgi:hypothetical protein
MDIENYAAMTDLQLLALAEDWFNRMIYRSEKALAASTEYEAKKPGIVAWLKSRKRNKEDFNLRDAIAKNYTLVDLMDVWSWNERDAKHWASNLAGLHAYLQIRKALRAQGGI